MYSSENDHFDFQMSNLPRTPPADHRLVDQEHDAEIGVAFDVLADETRQLFLDSEEIVRQPMKYVATC